QQGHASEALAMMEPLAAEAPADADIRVHRGLALQQLGRHQEALDDFVQALESYDRLLQFAPRYDEAWFRRGAALWLMGRFEESLASYVRALDCNPSRFSAAFNIGTALLKLERYDQAFDAFERARALAPDHPYLLGAQAGAVLGACDFARFPELQNRVIEAVRDNTA